MVDLIRLAA